VLVLVWAVGTVVMPSPWQHTWPTGSMALWTTTIMLSAYLICRIFDF
jgi:hypothetical protein